MRRIRLALLTLSAAAAGPGCAATPEVVPLTPIPTTSIPIVIQQIGYGSDARFTWCESTACPARTVKTLAHLERAPFN